VCQLKVDGHGQAKILTSDEIARLFREGLQSDRDRALFGLCLYTGCRINEACTRLSRDVYRDSGSVRGEVLIRKKDTKGQQATRSIQVHPQLQQWLELYRPQVEKEYLFPGRWGRSHIKPISAHWLLKQALQRVEIVGASTHSFRRTALTQMSAAGIPLRVIQEISGHTSLAALQKYLEVSEEQKSQAIAALTFWLP
jgi:integrase/recombinase XerD